MAAVVAPVAPAAAPALDQNIMAHINGLFGGPAATLNVQVEGTRAGQAAIISGLTFQELNKFINRVDTEKDAQISKLAVGDNAEYARIANILYGNTYNGKGYSDKVSRIKAAIATNPRYTANLTTQITWLKKPISTGPGAPPEPEKIAKINFAYQDSGNDPKSINPNITYVLTPGSYIDPASRGKGGVYFPAVGTPITISQALFNFFGFPNITFTGIINADLTCNVDLDTRTLGGFLNSQIRSASFDHVGFNKDYYTGNPQKNADILKLISDEPPDYIAKINMYLLCKELGDFLQILFALISILSTSYENVLQHCVFTTDAVVGARCTLMGIPYCEQDHLKENKLIHSAYYHAPQTDPEVNLANLKRIHKEHCIKNNNKIIFDLTKALIQGINVGGTAIQVSPEQQDPVRQYIQSIIESIGETNMVVSAYLSPGNETIEIYKEKMTLCLAESIINTKGKITQSASRLYKAGPDPFAAAAAAGAAGGVVPRYRNDIIFSSRAVYGRTVAEQLVRLSNTVRVPITITQIVLNSQLAPRSRRQVVRGGTRKMKGGVVKNTKSNTSTTRQLTLKGHNRHMTVKASRIAHIANHRTTHRATLAKQSIHPRSTKAKKMLGYIKKEKGILSSNINTIFMITLFNIGCSQYNAESFLYLIYGYFEFIGQTPLDPNYLKRLYDAIRQRPEILDKTLREFKRDHWDPYEDSINSEICNEELNRRIKQAKGEFKHEIPLNCGNVNPAAFYTPPPSPPTPPADMNI